MPVIEMMMLDFEGELGVRPGKVFNVDAAVGQGAPNNPGDVMLIQAMLKGISLVFTYEFRNAKLSEPTGRIDQNTIGSIWALQRTWSDHLLAVDGRIDPASFAGRKLRLRAKKVTILQMMDRYLGQALSIKWHEEDHIEGLMRLYPQLRAHVRDKTNRSNTNLVA